MNLESIYLALSESYRKALIAFVACTLIVYPLLYFGLPSFHSLEWYTQILISSGFGISYVGTFACFFLPVMKRSDAFLLSIGLLAGVAFSEWIRIAFGNEADLKYCFVRLLVIFSLGFLISLLLSKANKFRGTIKEEDSTK